MSDTLVLDRNYQPIGTVPWSRSIALLWEGKVAVEREYPDRVVRSPSIEIPIPSVIRFLNATRKRKKALKFSRENVYARDGGKCQYCAMKLDRTEITYDHVVPRSKNGKTEWVNILLCCVRCNQKKGGRTPQEAGMRALSVPVKPTSLPTSYFLLEYRKGMPESWREFLRDQTASAVYWHAELQEE